MSLKERSVVTTSVFLGERVIIWLLVLNLLISAPNVRVKDYSKPRIIPVTDQLCGRCSDTAAAKKSY